MTRHWNHGNSPLSISVADPDRFGYELFRISGLTTLNLFVHSCKKNLNEQTIFHPMLKFLIWFIFRFKNKIFTVFQSWYSTGNEKIRSRNTAFILFFLTIIK